jgi:hypothetical protein
MMTMTTAIDAARPCDARRLADEIRRLRDAG